MASFQKNNVKFKITKMKKNFFPILSPEYHREINIYVQSVKKIKEHLTKLFLEINYALTDGAKTVRLFTSPIQ